MSFWHYTVYYLMLVLYYFVCVILTLSVGIMLSIVLCWYNILSIISIWHYTVCYLMFALYCLLCVQYTDTFCYSGIMLVKYCVLCYVGIIVYYVMLVLYCILCVRFVEQDCSMFKAKSIYA